MIVNGAGLSEDDLSSLKAIEERLSAQLVNVDPPSNCVVILEAEQAGRVSHRIEILLRWSHSRKFPAEYDEQTRVSLGEMPFRSFSYSSHYLHRSQLERRFRGNLRVISTSLLSTMTECSHTDDHAFP